MKYIYLMKVFYIIFKDTIRVKGDYVAKINQIIGYQGLIYLIVDMYGTQSSKSIIGDAYKKSHGNMEHFSYELMNKARAKLMLKYQ